MIASVLLALAISLFLIAVLVWHLGKRSATQKSTRAYLQQALLHLEQDPHLDVAPRTSSYVDFGPASWNNLIARAGHSPTQRLYLQWLFIVMAVFCLVLVSTTVLLAVVSLLLSGLGLGFYLVVKADRIKQRMNKQLPDFLESMARLLTIGNSLSAAFSNSLPTMEAPLRLALDRVSALMYSGQSFDIALQNVANQYRSKELSLIAGVVAIATQFGGRSDLVFQRMARFMRDQEQARHELHALSSEIRLSAWILALLPLGMAGAIIVINPHLLINMWQDSTGKIMLLAALFLQIAGSYWLYKLAKSI